MGNFYGKIPKKENTMKRKLILFIILPLLFLSCSQKISTIDGQANKFAHKFYPAMSIIPQERFLGFGFSLLLYSY